MEKSLKKIRFFRFSIRIVRQNGRACGGDVSRIRLSASSSQRFSSPSPAAMRASLAIAAFLLLAVLPRHTSRAGVINLSAGDSAQIDLSCPPAQTTAGTNAGDHASSIASRLLESVGAKSWNAEFFPTNACLVFGSSSALLSCDAAGGSLTFSQFSDPACGIRVNQLTFQRQTVSSAGNCFKLSSQVFGTGGAIAFADCSSSSAMPGLASDQGAVLFNAASKCPPSGVALSSVTNFAEYGIARIGFPGVVVPRDLFACPFGRYQDWPNFQVDFLTGSDGKQVNLYLCQQTSLYGTTLPPTDLVCSTTNVGGGSRAPFAYQIIPMASTKLSAGAIVGITVGVLAACAIIGFFGYRYYRQRQQGAQSGSAAAARLAGSESLMAAGASDVQYEPVSGAYVKMPATV